MFHITLQHTNAYALPVVKKCASRVATIYHQGRAPPIENKQQGAGAGWPAPEVMAREKEAKKGKWNYAAVEVGLTGGEGFSLLN